MEHWSQHFAEIILDMARLVIRYKIMQVLD